MLQVEPHSFIGFVHLNLFHHFFFGSSCCFFLRLADISANTHDNSGGKVHDKGENSYHKGLTELAFIMTLFFAFVPKEYSDQSVYPPSPDSLRCMHGEIFVLYSEGIANSLIRLSGTPD